MRFFSPLLILAALLAAACGGAAVLPDEFTRERADGKIPVSIELIKKQTQKEIDGMSEGQAKAERWQLIEADYNDCRLSSSRKTKAAADKVFADCMSRKGYVYMYRLDAEQLHGDIAGKMVGKRRAAEKEAAELASKENLETLAAEAQANKERSENDLVLQARDGNLDKVRRLLNAGVSANAVNRKGGTALGGAAALNHIEIVRVLLDAGANPNARTKIGGATALMFAAVSGHREVVKMLLGAGANPHMMFNNGWTALISTAQEEGYPEIAKMLLAAGANPNWADNKGLTALMHATYNSHVEVIKVLLDAGANPNMANKDGLTALMSAANGTYSEIVQMLLAAGANPNMTNKKGFTALMFAAHGGDFEIARMLLTAGANPNSRDKDGWTALLYAASNEKPEVAKMLLACGANPKTKNKRGMNAWNWAKEHPIILPVFEEYQRKVDAGWQPKSCAVKQQPQQPKKPAAKAKETVYNQQQGGNMNNSTQKTISQKLQEKHDAIAARSDHSNVMELEQKIGRAIFTWIFAMQNLDQMIIWLGGESGGRKDYSRISQFKKLCRKCADQGMVCGYKELCKNLEITLKKRSSIVHDLPSLVFTGRFHKKIVKGKEIYHLQSDPKKMREMEDKFSSIQEAYRQVVNFLIQMPQAQEVLEKFDNELSSFLTDKS